MLGAVASAKSSRSPGHRRRDGRRRRRGFGLRAALPENDFPAPPEPERACEYIRSVVRETDRLIASSGATVGEDWREVATPPGASCRVQVTRPRTRLRMALDTAEQAKGEFELLSKREAGVSGALPLFLEIGSWPSWYPFCRSANLLREWCPQELCQDGDGAQAAGAVWGAGGGLSRAALWHLVFRLGPLLYIDTIGLAVERPGMLEEQGELWHYVFSPEDRTQSGESGTCFGR